MTREITLILLAAAAVIILVALYVSQRARSRRSYEAAGADAALAPVWINAGGTDSATDCGAADGGGGCS